MHDSDKFDSWGIVEVMGHNRFAGRITEQQIGGTAFVRVDVPATERQPAFTKLLGSGAIYAITITDEATATAVARQNCARPVEVYVSPALTYAGRDRDDDGAY